MTVSIAQFYEIVYYFFVLGSFLVFFLGGYYDYQDKHRLNTRPTDPTGLSSYGGYCV